MLFTPEIMLHVSRPIRWDSDHVVILNDDVQDLAREIVRCDALDRVHIGLDYFDATINRIGAYVIGSRATQKAFMLALLEPIALLRQYEDEGKYFQRLALQEEAKSLPICMVEGSVKRSRMKERITRMNRSLFELETGILIFGIAGQLILFFFAGRGLYSAAWWIGIATAAVCAVDMWWALDRGLDLGRQGAAKKIMVHYMIRYVVIAIVLVIVALTDTLNPLITFAGVMGLKIGAYLNFFAKKVSTWIYGEEILPDLVEIPEEEM